jgi:hypothetical protein
VTQGIPCPKNDFYWWRQQNKEGDPWANVALRQRTTVVEYLLKRIWIKITRTGTIPKVPRRVGFSLRERVQAQEQMAQGISLGGCRNVVSELQQTTRGGNRFVQGNVKNFSNFELGKKRN